MVCSGPRTVKEWHASANCSSFRRRPESTMRAATAKAGSTASCRLHAGRHGDHHSADRRFTLTGKRQAIGPGLNEVSSNKKSESTWSGRLDSNQRPPAPHAGALPNCATPRPVMRIAQHICAFKRTVDLRFRPAARRNTSFLHVLHWWPQLCLAGGTHDSYAA